MWVAIQTMDEDNIDESPTRRGIDLCEAVTTDLGGFRGCLEEVSTGGAVPIIGRREAGTYHHCHAEGNAEELRRRLCI